jgi:hypothetical protein
VAYFLGAAYSKNIKLAGIIYHHRITDTRMGGSALKNVNMFKALCGSVSLSNVVLATTMWDKLKDPEAVQRGCYVEKEIKKDDSFWGDMVDCGSRMFRHHGTPASALHIVDYIMELKGYVVLDIQRQMIDEHETLDNTSAGREVQKDLLKAKARYEKELKETQESMKAAMDAGNQKMADKLAKLQHEYQAKIANSDRETKQLKENFEKIQKDGDEKYNKMIRELQAENQRALDIANERQKNIDALEDRQRQTESQINSLRNAGQNRETQWKLRMATLDAEKAQRQKEIKDLADKRRAAEEAARSSSGTASILKNFLGTAMGAGGVLVANPLWLALERPS